MRDKRVQLASQFLVIFAEYKLPLQLGELLRKIYFQVLLRWFKNGVRAFALWKGIGVDSLNACLIFFRMFSFAEETFILSYFTSSVAGGTITAGGTPLLCSCSDTSRARFSS